MTDSDDLLADFEMRYPSGTSVAARLCRPARGFSVTVLFGPSGGGKTTILRCLAGLETPQKGSIHFGTQTWLDADRGISLRPQLRDIGYLSQEYFLFPHLRVAANVGFALKSSSRSERYRTIAAELDRFGLNGLEKRYPRELSGGQQQRVALARALARRPRLLLLDEPLSALDAPTREQLRRDLRQTLSHANIPVLLVTHDRIEAISMADHLVVMDQGRILQQGGVQEVFSRPASLAVARVAGVETVEAGRVVSIAEGLATVQVGAGLQLLALAGDVSVGEVYVCIRAEEVVLQTGPTSSSARNQLPATIASLMPEGPMVRVEMNCGIRLNALITRISSEEMKLKPGAHVTAILKAPAIHLIARR